MAIKSLMKNENKNENLKNIYFIKIRGGERRLLNESSTKHFQKIPFFIIYIFHNYRSSNITKKRLISGL